MRVPFWPLLSPSPRDAAKITHTAHTTVLSSSLPCSFLSWADHNLWVYSSAEETGVVSSLRVWLSSQRRLYGASSPELLGQNTLRYTPGGGISGSRGGHLFNSSPKYRKRLWRFCEVPVVLHRCQKSTWSLPRPLQNYKHVWCSQKNDIVAKYRSQKSLPFSPLSGTSNAFKSKGPTKFQAGFENPEINL